MGTEITSRANIKGRISIYLSVSYIFWLNFNLYDSQKSELLVIDKTTNNIIINNVVLMFDEDEAWFII